MIVISRDGIPVMVDPNSAFGLRAEGGLAHKRGVLRDQNPYSNSHPTSLAEKHWFEGWDLYTKYAAQTATAQ